MADQQAPGQGQAPASEPTQGQNQNQTPSWKPEEVEQWRSIALEFETRQRALAEHERQLQEQAQALQQAAALDQALRSDPRLLKAVQDAFIRLQQGDEGSGGAGAQPAAPTVPPEFLAFLQAQAQQVQGVTQKVQTLEEQQREYLVRSQVERLRQKYEFARPDEVVNLLMDYPGTDIEKAMAASHSYWQSEFQRYEEAMAKKRQDFASRSTLGPSGGPAVTVDKSLLASPTGRRQTLQQLAAILASQGGNG